MPTTDPPRPGGQTGGGTRAGVERGEGDENDPAARNNFRAAGLSKTDRPD